MGLIILFGIFFLGLIVGAPVAFAVGLAAVVTFLYEGLPLFVAFQRILSGISVFSLLAIPSWPQKLRATPDHSVMVLPHVLRRTQH